MASEMTPEYIAMLQRLDGREKLRTAFRIYWSARKLKAAGLRDRHPEWTEQQVQDEVKRIFLHAST